MGSVTIKDIAREVGVSISTVSRVIHDNPRISDDTKIRVREAMDRMNYHPNALARGLARSSTSNIGLILPNDSDTLFQNPFFIEAMRGIGVKSQSEGFNLMFSFSRDENEEIGFISNYINSGWVDGIILFTSRKKDLCIEFLQERNFPFVVIGRPGEYRNVFWVDNDNVQSMYSLVNQVISKGARSIAFIGGPEEMWVTADRLSGYRQAMEFRGITVDEDQISFGRDFSEEEGRECMKELLKKGTPDAVVTTDDYLAFGALEEMDERGLDNIIVTGFNNSIKSRYFHRGLSTVDVNPVQLGEEAAGLLIEQVKHGSMEPASRIIKTEFIERESTQRNS